MTYCDYEWLSDFTYEGLMSYFQANLSGAAMRSRLDGDQVDRLLVMGSIDPATSEVRLQTLFVIPNAGDIFPRTPGAYAIVLRGAGGDGAGALSLYPGGAIPGAAPALDARCNRRRREEELLAIRELVPYVAGTVRVDIEGPSGPAQERHGGRQPAHGDGDLAQRRRDSWTARQCPSPGPPAIADGDPLRFNVQYSRDNGATWEMLAQDVEGNSVELDASQSRLDHAGAFRVWASDGIHTAYDTVGCDLYRAQPCAAGGHPLAGRRQHRGHQPDGGLRRERLRCGYGRDGSRAS